MDCSKYFFTQKHHVMFYMWKLSALPQLQTKITWKFLKIRPFFVNCHCWAFLLVVMQEHTPSQRTNHIQQRHVRAISPTTRPVHDCQHQYLSWCALLQEARWTNIWVCSVKVAWTDNTNDKILQVVNDCLRFRWKTLRLHAHLFWFVCILSISAWKTRIM